MYFFLGSVVTDGKYMFYCRKNKKSAADMGNVLTVFRLNSLIFMINDEVNYK